MACRPYESGFDGGTSSSVDLLDIVSAGTSCCAREKAWIPTEPAINVQSQISSFIVTFTGTEAEPAGILLTGIVGYKSPSSMAFDGPCDANAPSSFQ